MNHDDITRRSLYPSTGPSVDSALSNRTVGSNQHAARWVSRVEAYVADSATETRHQALECRSCFYLRPGGMLCGHERVNCKQCDGPFWQTGGDDHDVCVSCAEAYSICRRCGGDIDSDERRRKLVRKARR